MCSERSIKHRTTTLLEVELQQRHASTDSQVSCSLHTTIPALGKRPVSETLSLEKTGRVENAGNISPKIVRLHTIFRPTMVWHRVHFGIIHELTRIKSGLLRKVMLNFLEDISENTGILLSWRQVFS
jgi:hypothetical protein